MRIDLYKYGRSEHEKCLFEHGTVRVGTIYDYRRNKGPMVGDVDEGRVRIGGEFTNLGPESFRDTPLESLFRFGESAKAKLTIKNSTFGPGDRYAFCASLSYSGDAHKRWYFEEHYDSCYHISSARLFFRALSRAMKIQKLATCLGFGPVGYHDAKVDIKPDSPLAKLNSGMLKDFAYAGQVEARVLFRPDKPGPIEPFNIDVPDLVKYCSHYRSIS